MKPLRPRRLRLDPFDTFAALLQSPDAIGTWIFSLSLPKPRPKSIPGLSDMDLQPLAGYVWGPKAPRKLLKSHEKP